ncbi:MAG: fructosamine kinase family protein [Gammaproteobacteria bacterium]|nr:fructosamine kinase family protein [Gammaproteobacteria bacterium]
MDRKTATIHRGTRRVVNPWQHISEHIEHETGVQIRGGRDAIGGGCINQAVRIAGEGRDFFVKFNVVSKSDMFVAEAEGLRELAATRTIRVPEPVCWGVAGDTAYLVLDHLEFGHGDKGAVLGEQLAALHRVTRADFGWHRDNTIGSTPQINTPCVDWITFWRERRFGFQLELAQRNGLGGDVLRLGGQLMDRLDGLFDGYHPRPSLLHGDLWSGNHGYLADGMPVIFDPAVYFGDREADVAMTELFGGFGADFYAGYRAAWPLDVGYATRKTLYNLYHILNHANLFGGGYEQQALRMIQQLLGELR